MYKIDLCHYDIIMISGGINSGKDTVYQILKEKFDYGLINKKFAYNVKLFASLLLNVDVEKFEEREFKDSLLPKEWLTTLKHNYLGFDIKNVNYTVRDMLVIIGDGMRKILHPDCWAISLFNEYKDISYGKWVITDFRYNNEYQMALKYTDRILKIYVDRKQDVNYSYGSENGFGDIKFDVILDNNSDLEHLYNQIGNRFCNTDLPF